MKKIFTTIVVAAFTALLAFATDSYSVKSITGKVQFEAAPGNWKNLSVGQKVSSSTVINTSPNSVLVLTGESGDVSIKAMQKGTVQALTSAGSAKGGIKKGSGISKNGVAGAATSNSKGVATASSRASEAKADMDWDE
ncbi:MAG: hypothetical protein II821_08920 [Treponema sp.]|nr:hypothetical protein [Treponema sp.]